MNQKHFSHSENRFFKMFPPPAFLLMESSGVDISDRAIRFISFEKRKQGLAIKRFGEQNLPEGVVVNGEIKDPTKLKDSLIALRKDYGLSFVRVALPEEKAFLFVTEVPVLSSEETKTNLSFQMEENVPLKPGEVVLDYRFANKTIIGGVDEKREAAVSVFPIDVANSYHEVFRDAGLIPLSFEVEGSAIGRAVIKTGDMGAYMVTDIGELRTGITIFNEGIMQFSTTVDMGGSLLTDTIKDKLKISHEEAIILKREGSFSRHGKHRDLFQVLVEAFEPLKEEIKRRYVYWHNHSEKNKHNNPEIKKVIMCGSDAYLEGLAEHLTLDLRSPVEVADVWQNAFSVDEYIPPLPFHRSLAFATAIGLALRNE